MDTDPGAFFAACPQAEPLYKTLLERMMEALPPFELRMSRTQISFYNRYGFACVSLPRRRLKEGQRAYLTVSFGLGRRDEHPRIAQIANPYPGRYTHHLEITDASGIDAELMAWLKEAYMFSALK